MFQPVAEHTLDWRRRLQQHVAQAVGCARAVAREVVVVAAENPDRAGLIDDQRAARTMGGACGTCRARLVTGTVEMDQNFALGKADLTCCYYTSN